MQQQAPEEKSGLVWAGSGERWRGSACPAASAALHRFGAAGGLLRSSLQEAVFLRSLLGT